MVGSAGKRRLEAIGQFRHALEAMAKKKKPQLKPAKEARRRARLGIGLPPPEKTIPNKRERSQKHKKTLGDLLTTE
jgi:hypothetical protein